MKRERIRGKLVEVCPKCGEPNVRAQSSLEKACGTCGFVWSAMPQQTDTNGLKTESKVEVCPQCGDLKVGRQPLADTTCGACGFVLRVEVCPRCGEPNVRQQPPTEKTCGTCALVWSASRSTYQNTV